jgi:hypothetical protein
VRPEERVRPCDIAAQEVIQPSQLPRDGVGVGTEWPGPAAGLECPQALLQRAPLGLAILHERGGRLAHDAGQDGPLDVPELLLDPLQLLFEAAPGLTLRDPERVGVSVTDVIR